MKPGCVSKELTIFLEIAPIFCRGFPLRPVLFAQVSESNAETQHCAGGCHLAIKANDTRAWQLCLRCVAVQIACHWGATPAER